MKSNTVLPTDFEMKPTLPLSVMTIRDLVHFVNIFSLHAYLDKHMRIQVNPDNNNLFLLENIYSSYQHVFDLQTISSHGYTNEFTKNLLSDMAKHLSEKMTSSLWEENKVIYDDKHSKILNYRETIETIEDVFKMAEPLVYSFMKLQDRLSQNRIIESSWEVSPQRVTSVASTMYPASTCNTTVMTSTTVTEKTHSSRKRK